MATFYNKATLTYNNGTADSNIVTGELAEVLTARKTALESDYSTDCPLTYVVSLVNSGANPFTGLTVTDDLGAYAFGDDTLTPLTYDADSVKYYVNGALATAPTVTSTSPLTFSGLSVPANGNALLIYKARANEYAPLGATASITNTATVSGPTLPTDIAVSETIARANEPDLSIGKTLSPDTVTENSEVTYTFILQNRGSAAADVDANVAVTDTFDPVLSSLTATLDSTALTEGTDYTYDTGTGVFRTVPGRITIPAATYAVDPTTGAYSVTPGVAVLRVTGII
ncbi:MAG: hypothetical protein NC084_08465 [Bacteroides sp.]|nr:hypothetical protein [Eubacterium sp.]MCM1418700.1 hypothetical protein [Roseburia sp.]MCM1462728.1 hypothetical protein [Bacteroides sp.]